MRFQQKLDILKTYEVPLYSLCRYLLANEQRAVEAAKETLVKLFQDDSFFSRGSDQERRAMIFAAASRQCLRQHDLKRGVDYANG